MGLVLDFDDESVGSKKISYDYHSTIVVTRIMELFTKVKKW